MGVMTPTWNTSPATSGHQSGDFRTREHMKPVANVQSNISVTDEQSPVFGIGEDRSAIELLITRLLQTTPNEILSEDGINQPTAVRPVCFSCGGEGHGIN